MDEVGVSDSHSLISEEKADRLYPLCFGVSFALSALRLLSEPADMDADEVSEKRRRMLQGGAELLGLLVWRIQRVGWDDEKRGLILNLQKAKKEIEELKQRRQEDAKSNEKVVGILAAQEQSWFVERKKLLQHFGSLRDDWRALETNKDETIDELNEKVRQTERVAEETRETAKRDAQEHSSELWKHKTAFIELMSSHRQLEAEMGRVLRKAETAGQELEVASEVKKESAEILRKLSVQNLKLQRDLEQKDKVLSAILRKLKLDAEEKQMLLKEVKLCRVKMRRAELEAERLRAASQSRHTRHSLRSILPGHSKTRLSASSMAAESSHAGGTKLSLSDLLLEYTPPGHAREPMDISPVPGHHSHEGNDELVIGADAKNFQKCMAAVEKRHDMEIEAFIEQMRVKDEKLEASRWRLMSMELETKRLQSHMEALNRGLPQAPTTGHDDKRSKLDSLKEYPRERELETKTVLVEVCRDTEHEKAWKRNQAKGIILALQSPEKSDDDKDASMEPVCIQGECGGLWDTVEKKTAPVGQCSNRISNESRKMDLHALGVVYKIKRLKQQLLMVERLTGKLGSAEHGEIECDNKATWWQVSFGPMLSLLDRHVTRYQSLQERTDDLYKQMHENNLCMSSNNSATRTKEETRALERFLEEAFKLQRCIVAAGQKLTEIQSKIDSGFQELDENIDHGWVNFNLKQFSEGIRALYREIQRGLQLQIVRIIGDLQGTLAHQCWRRDSF